MPDRGRVAGKGREPDEGLPSGPAAPIPLRFRLRLALGDRLFALAAWVMPEHRYHSYSDEQTITIWREPA